MERVRTLPEALAEAARSREGYVFVDRGVERFRSYVQLWRRASMVAVHIRELGIETGTVVGLILTDPEAFLTAFFGASLAGVIPASLSPPGVTSQRDHYLRATTDTLEFMKARAVITSDSLADVLRASCPKMIVMTYGEPTAGRSSGFGELRAPVFAPEAIAFVQFTSGSSSSPRGVAITHRNLSANIDAINGSSGLASSSSDSAVSWLPLSHDMGLVGMALSAMYCGRPAVLLTPEAFVRRPLDWLRAISRHRATISFAPNFAYELCVRRVKDRDLEGLDLSCWRVAGCGGEPIHAATLRAFAERFGAVGFRETSFVPSYGLAEHVLAVTLAPRDRKMRVERLRIEDVAARGEAVPQNFATAGVDVISCGPPLPGHRIRIVDGNLTELPERAIGEVTLAGPSVMDGYFGDQELTAQTIRSGWLHTGDVGYLADGELFVCGRSKDLVIVNGRKYHPQDLEWAVSALSGIRRGHVVAFASTMAGSHDRVIIVAEPSGTERAEALTESIKKRVADVCGLRVDGVVLVPNGTIGRTTSGKVQRAVTKARYERGEFRKVG